MFKYRSPEAERAENEIAGILAKLEQETGCIVKSIGLEGIDVTTIESQSTDMQLAVSIELERPPGHYWRKR